MKGDSPHMALDNNQKNSKSPHINCHSPKRQDDLEVLTGPYVLYLGKQVKCRGHRMCNFKALIDRFGDDVVLQGL